MHRATMTSVAEYLSASYRPDCDYVDGLVLERNLGEFDHSRLQMRVLAYFFHRETQWGIRVVPEQRVQVSPTRFRIPDVTVSKAVEPVEQIITRPPFLCIEILSKDDTLVRVRERIEDYLRFGVPQVWVLDPQSKTCHVFGVDAERVVHRGHLTTSDPDITVSMEALFGLGDGFVDPIK